jgi:hypothetical protein
MNAAFVLVPLYCLQLALEAIHSTILEKGTRTWQSFAAWVPKRRAEAAAVKAIKAVAAVLAAGLAVLLEEQGSSGGSSPSSGSSSIVGRRICFV